MDFASIAEIIRSDTTLRSATFWHRELLDVNNKTEAMKRKKDTPQIAVAFHMEGGKGEKNCGECLYHTFVDFDDKDKMVGMAKEKLQETFHILGHNSHTILGYKSISGRGYHAIVPYCLPEGITIDIAADPKRATEIYKRVHAYINRYFQGITKQKMDEQCGNANRMVGLSHDPDVIYNPTALPFRLTRHDIGINENGELIKYSKNKKGSKKQVSIPAEGNFDRAVQMLTDDGLEFQPGHRHDFLVRLSFILNRMGVNQEEAEQAIDNAYASIYTEERPSKVLSNCYRHSEDEHGIWTMKSQADSKKQTKMEKIANFLRNKPLRYDIISRKVQSPAHTPAADEDIPEIRLWKELQERDINDLLYECNKLTGENISSPTFRTVLNSSIIPSVNPLHIYLSSLQPWDDTQEDFIDRVAQTVHIKDGKDALWRTCFKKWFVAMVASWLSDDVVNHQVIVLLGEQGIYKTTWLDRLIPPCLEQYRSKQTLSERIDKDEQLRAAEYALINFDEIDKLGERGLNELKSLITTSHIDVRAPYGYGKEKRTRIASYVASGNKEQFLTDQTGNRRWLPFLVESIDSPFDAPLPYDGMYAQAVRLIQDGFNYWFSIDDTHQLSDHVNSFMVESNEEQLLPVYFSPASKDSQGTVFLTVAEISAKLTVYGNIRNPLTLRQLGMLLKKLGYVAVRTTKRRGYIVIERSTEEINAQRRILAHQNNDVMTL